MASLVPVLMRLPLPRVAGVLTAKPARSGPWAPAEDTETDRLVGCVDAVRVACHPLVRGGCLTRAVTLHWFLSRRGLPVELCFGVATDGEPVGHAWLVLDNAPFLETCDPSGRFTETYRVTAAQP